MLKPRFHMKITGIRIYQVDLPLHEGSYQWSGGKSVSVFDSSVVEILTDSSLTGYGEVCPLGPCLSSCVRCGRESRYSRDRSALAGARSNAAAGISPSHGSGA